MPSPTLRTDAIRLAVALSCGGWLAAGMASCGSGRSGRGAAVPTVPDVQVPSPEVGAVGAARHASPWRARFDPGGMLTCLGIGNVCMVYEGPSGIRLACRSAGEDTDVPYQWAHAGRLLETQPLCLVEQIGIATTVSCPLGVSGSGMELFVEELPEAGDAEHLAVHYTSRCRDRNETVECAGRIMGRGEEAWRQISQGVPSVPVSDWAMSERFACFVENGSVWCLGDNNSGQLGAPSVGLVRSNVPINVALPVAVQSVVVGARHACALARGTGVYCWGNDGFDSETPSVGRSGAEPTLVFSSATAVGLASSPFRTCVVEQDGSVLCGDRGLHNRVLGPVADPTAVEVCILENFVCRSLDAGEVECGGT